jgi:hypothetical protein
MYGHLGVMLWPRMSKARTAKLRREEQQSAKHALSNRQDLKIIPIGQMIIIPERIGNPLCFPPLCSTYRTPRTTPRTTTLDFGYPLDNAVGSSPEKKKKSLHRFLKAEAE